MRIAPVFGKLHAMEGILPTPNGNIIFNLKRTKNKLTAEIKIPETMTGTLVWQGTEIALSKGNKTYKLKGSK